MSIKSDYVFTEQSILRVSMATEQTPYADEVHEMWLKAQRVFDVTIRYLHTAL